MLLSFILTPTGLSAAPRFVSSGRLLPHQINFQCEREVWSTPLAGSLFLFVFALCIELTYFLIIMIVSFLYIEDKRKKKCFLRALVNYIKWPWQVNVSDLWILFVILNWLAFCKYVILFFSQHITVNVLMNHQIFLIPAYVFHQHDAMSMILLFVCKRHTHYITQINIGKHCEHAPTWFP